MHTGKNFSRSWLRVGMGGFWVKGWVISRPLWWGKLNVCLFLLLPGSFNFKVIPSVTTVRQLTQAQTSEALRPFLFAVHPDFFGKYPKERAINEHSLKQLFAYIDGLKQRGNVSPTHLTFYLRNQQHKEPEKPPAEQPKPTEPTPPRAVNISLLGNDIFSTVSHVLKSCDISTNHVKQSSSPHHDFYRPIEWHHTYYTYTAKRNPFEGYPPSKPDVTLRYFLRRNIPKARKHLHLSSQCRDEAQSHEKRLITNLQLCNISWQSSWNVSAYRTCLKALDRLCQSNKSVTENLKGRHVVFGNRSMLGCDGSIRLSSEDVPQQWQMSKETLMCCCQVRKQHAEHYRNMKRSLKCSKLGIVTIHIGK
ncbi:putative T-cell activation inhibitor, mitochondrial [Apostichopus japonicus]|uniref:Putative T-cell activation inhibitor, mitochondrial n=1 Tax=Stichopus japonicus TaxID=307972 RepID=A0A2G8LQW3_STIJA|nr:putative T-cell activation inhibitor, mitochondrial [Apostichopus japonicus]